MTEAAEAAGRARQRLRRLAWWLDERFRIPGTRFRFGVESLLGLIPLGGDLLGLALSAYAVQQAVVLGAPRRLVLRMLGNVGIDFLLGLLPGVGDLADMAFKANTRNLRLLEAHLDALDPTPAAAPARQLGRRIGGALLWVVLMGLGLAAVVAVVRALLGN